MGVDKQRCIGQSVSFICCTTYQEGGIEDQYTGRLREAAVGQS